MIKTCLFPYSSREVRYIWCFTICRQNFSWIYTFCKHLTKLLRFTIRRLILPVTYLCTSSLLVIACCYCVHMEGWANLLVITDCVVPLCRLAKHLPLNTWGLQNCTKFQGLNLSGCTPVAGCSRGSPSSQSCSVRVSLCKVSQYPLFTKQLLHRQSWCWCQPIVGGVNY